MVRSSTDKVQNTIYQVFGIGTQVACLLKQIARVICGAYVSPRMHTES